MAALADVFALLAAEIGLAFLGDTAGRMGLIWSACLLAIVTHVVQAYRGADRVNARPVVKQPDDVVVQKCAHWNASIGAFVTTFDVVCSASKAPSPHFISAMEATGRAKAFAARHRLAVWFEADPNGPAVLLESFRSADSL